MNAAVNTRVTPIVALDVSSLAAAQALVEQLGDSCGFYKVGLELYAAEGPAVVTWLREQRKAVFVDLKLHDIPNTVKSAARSLAQLGASLLTVHASGGTAMVRAAVEGAEEGGGCSILAVTVLTSLDASALGAAWGRSSLDVQEEVLRLAHIAAEAGARGIVCSGREVEALRGAFGARLAPLVPGIRMAGGSLHDQARVVTPAMAALLGAEWIVLGRAVTGAADVRAAMQAVWAELK